MTNGHIDVARLIADLQDKRRALQASLDAVELLLVNVQRVYPTGVVAPVNGGPSSAAERRLMLLERLEATAAGLTMKELQAQTPLMAAAARRNALHTLKTRGQIKHVGKKWVARQASR